MSSIPMSFTCLQCGRDASKIFSCPDRKDGACPFARQWIARKSISFIFFSIVFVVVSAGMFDAGPLIPYGLGLVFLLWLMTMEVQLYNAASGVALQRTTVAGIQIRCKTMAGCRTASIDLKPTRSPQYPLSVVAVANCPQRGGDEGDRAAQTFRAALIDLLTRHLIEIHVMPYYETTIWNPTPAPSEEYYVVSAWDGQHGLKLGGLEGDILRTIRGGAWKSSKGTAWVKGPRLYDLVHAFYQTDETDPARWLLEYVEKDAKYYGLCEIERIGFLGSVKRAKWYEPYSDKLQADFETADDLAEQVKRMCPDLWDESYLQIKKGIKSRIDNSD